jgi:hypothetical protein
VETREQLRVIRELEIGAGQGFLLGRPDPSVAATFVDIARLGGDIVAPAVAREAVLVGASEVAVVVPTHAPADDRSLAERLNGRTIERPAQRGIILPTSRLTTQLELERSAA